MPLTVTIVNLTRSKVSVLSPPISGRMVTQCGADHTLQERMHVPGICRRIGCGTGTRKQPFLLSCGVLVRSNRIRLIMQDAPLRETWTGHLTPPPDSFPFLYSMQIQVLLTVFSTK